MIPPGQGAVGRATPSSLASAAALVVMGMWTSSQFPNASGTPSPAIALAVYAHMFKKTDAKAVTAINPALR